MAKSPGDFQELANNGPDSRTTVIRPETTPLYTTSVYTFPSLEDVRDFYSDPESSYLYRRNGNPNTKQLEGLISNLEQTQASVLASSGMAAIAQTCFALLKPGDHVLATEVLYGGTYAFFEQILRPWGVDVEYLDLNDINKLIDRTNESTRLIYAETIANPLLQVTNLPALGQFSRDHSLFLVVDNTFATPVLTRPSQFGATVVVESLTKYLNGHSDVIGGVCSGPQEVIAKIRRFSETFGSILAPFDAWMTERGLLTLSLRMQHQGDNAMQLASALSQHESVLQVFYPGLSSHPSHPVAKEVLQGGFGAMVSFEIAGGASAVDQFVRACRHIQFAPSLGGVKTTLSHPGLTSHRALTPLQRNALGITDGVIRMSVGIEPFKEIWEDVLCGLRALNSK